LREVGVVAAFAVLTVVMTWPWAARLRDGVLGPGDPYINSWILWWDWHQTFRDPLNLFHANIFFPYRYTLAFSENHWGLALPLFPLFAAGLRPLTVHGVATLLGFLFSGYGAFRLGRTLTGSTGAGFVSGIVFAFVPYRFHLLPHLGYVFAGWIPILFEALVLFARKRSPRRAVWLGAAFLMNGLTCIHWLVLSAIPFALAVILLAFREGIERERAFLRRGALALACASLILLPFLVPYQRVASLYGFERNAQETLYYSAHLEHWLTAHPENRLWRGFGESPVRGELALFPGLLPLLLALAGLLLVRPDREPAPAPSGIRRDPPTWLLRSIDIVAIAAGTVALLASSPSGLKISWHDVVLLKATDPARGLAVLAVALLVRCSVAWPRALSFFRGRNLAESLRSARFPETLPIALVLGVTGFLGSLGMNTPFHRTLFEVLPLFRSIRVPARWAMIADLGIALLAGLGALLLARASEGRRRRGGKALFASASLLLLLEQREFPIELEKGPVDPDGATLFLTVTPMRGGIVDLPMALPGPYEAMLRAADHGKPLVNAVSGFVPPLIQKLDGLTATRPLPDTLLDALEEIPASYVVVHTSRIEPKERAAWKRFFLRGVASGRLRFSGRFDGDLRNDLFAVVKTEPGARPDLSSPWRVTEAVLAEERGQPSDHSLTGSLDEPAAGATVKALLRVQGWARIPGEDLDVTVLLDDEARRPSVERRTARPYVANAVPALGPCDRAGYEALFPFLPGDSGEHSVRVVFRARDGRIRSYPSRTFVWTR
jgi:hypothetical protein